MWWSVLSSSRLNLGPSSKNTPMRNCPDRGSLWTCVWRITLINGSWEIHSECDWVHSLGWGLNCVRVLEREQDPWVDSISALVCGQGSLSSCFDCSKVLDCEEQMKPWVNVYYWHGPRHVKDQCLRLMGAAKPSLGWRSEGWQRFPFFGLWQMWTVCACMSPCMNNRIVCAKKTASSYNLPQTLDNLSPCCA